jgi:phosphoribosyl 1,2-cyclic phosphate phosphodiesterase
MRWTLLGSGTSTGVPAIGCRCRVCLSSHPRNTRTRSSLWIQYQDRSILVDTSVDLRQQALREQIERVDAVLFTHAHADHIYGLDEIRSYNFIQKSVIPCYGSGETLAGVKRAFLTHLSHHFDYEEISSSLPESVSLAYDGLRIEIPFLKKAVETMTSRSAEEAV